MSTDIFRRYLDLLNEAETTGRLIGNQPFIPGKPLSPMQMATVDFARSMGNQMGPEVDRAYDLAKQSGVKPGGQSDSTTNKSDVSPTNARSDRTPTDFTPTHFHKNNLGSKIPLMQTPDGKFWWETTATGDDGGPVQKGGARKSIQPWTGDTENRSSGLSGKSSVDGVFKNGEPVEFPEGTTWKDFAKAIQTAMPARKIKEIPHINPGELVAPNTTVALPSSGTFTNDQALANLAAKMKDGTAEVSKTTGSKIDSPESLEILKQVKALAAKADSYPPFDLTDISKLEADATEYINIIEQMTRLITQSANLRQSGGDMSDTTKQQIADISESTVNKIMVRVKAIRNSIGGEGGKTKDGAAPGVAAAGGGASGAAGSLPAGIRWEYAKKGDDSAKKDGELPSGAGGTKLDRRTQIVDKETTLSNNVHCAQCGTPKSLHSPLKHEFVPGDDVQPGFVGKSTPSADQLDLDQARIDKMPKWDRSKTAPVGTTPSSPAPSPRPRPTKPTNEDINRLPAADQMRSWRQLMEAPSNLTAAQLQAQRAGLGRPGSLGIARTRPDTRNLADKLKAQDLQRFDTTASIDHTPIGSTNPPSSAGSTAQTPRRDYDRRGPSPKPATPELPGWAKSRIQGRPTGTAASAETMAARGIPGMDAPASAAAMPPAAPGNWKSLVKNSLRKIAAPASALYSVYEGWNKINALPKDTMSRAQYAAEVTKIVTKLVEENGIVLVSTWLGGLAGGAMSGGVGAIPGMIAGTASGIAAEYYFGDNISEVVNGVVDSLYGTGNTPSPAPQENKLTPKQIADYKAYVENTERWVADRTTWSPADQAANPWTKEDQAELDQYKALLKAAGVAVAPAPAPQAAEKVPAADSVAKYKATFDKANAVVDKIKNLDSKVLNPNDPAFDPKAAYNLLDGITSLFAAEIGNEAAKDPAVQKQMEAIMAAAREAADAKYTEAEGKGKTTTGGPKEGQTGMYDGKKVIYRNGKWVYQ